MDPVRVCMITNFIPPYRKTFYEKACLLIPYEWLILRGQVEGDTGRPEYRGTLVAPISDVKNVERNLGPFTIRFQKGAVAAVREHDPDVVIVLGMVGNLSNWVVMLWARLRRRKVLIWACGWARRWSTKLTCSNTSSSAMACRPSPGPRVFSMPIGCACVPPMTAN